MQMNGDEIVKALRSTERDEDEICELDCDCKDCQEELCHFPRLAGHAADLITSLRSQLRNARNELCLKCGRYREAHNGACDGCRWKEKLC